MPLQQGAVGSVAQACDGIGGAVASAATHAATADATGRLAPETVAQLTRAGFARRFVPGPWHGTEGTFGDLLADVARVGESCASAAWCAALWAVHAKYAAHLPVEGQRDLWQHSPDVRIAAALRPCGQAVALPDGWLLTGTWEFVSSIADADWVLLAAVVPHEAPRLFAVPTDAVRIQESWSCTGMRGTGSHTVVLEAPVVVPEHRTCELEGVLAGLPGPGRPPCHSAPAYLGTGLLMCAPALGVARGALREWAASAARHGSRPGPDGACTVLHLTLADATDEIESAELLLRDAAERADSGTRAERDVVRNRRIAAAAAHLLVSAVERLMREAGVRAYGGSAALERSWRDIHVLTAHQ
ncbi:oxidoreductase, partial [Streptomyces sp. SID14478]|uniref:acyl-CoA dehydrogenase family protein n=1 Tax=Streptomyces sp. SID14478 TaxID=2706073 RepID=UPI0013DF4864